MPTTETHTRTTTPAKPNLLARYIPALLDPAGCTIVGTARSGTRFTACVLASQLNRPVYHEASYITDMLEKDYPVPMGCVEVSWLAAPRLKRLRDKGWSTGSIVRLVRHPLKSVCSIIERGFLVPGNSYGELAARTLGLDINQPDLAGYVNLCLRYYLGWHRLIDELEPYYENLDLKTLSFVATRDQVHTYATWAQNQVDAHNSNLSRVRKPATHYIELEDRYKADPELVAELRDLAAKWGYY